MKDQERIERAIGYVVKAAVLLSNPPKAEQVVCGPAFQDVADAATATISGLFSVADTDDGAYLRIVGSQVDFQPCDGMSSEQLGLILHARITKVVRDAIGEVYEKAGVL